MFILDRQRSIVADIDNDFMIPIYNDSSSNITDRESLEKSRSFKPILCETDETRYFSTFIALHNYGAGEPWCGYLRLLRHCILSNGKEIYHTVDIPISNALMLYDNGLFIAGYKWHELESLEDIGVNSSSIGIEDITHINENIVCTATTKPDTLPDTWIRGDKIYNVGNETDWTIFIKK